MQWLTDTTVKAYDAAGMRDRERLAGIFQSESLVQSL
jgi:hypothetical protein